MCCMVLRCFATMAFACLVATPVIAEEADLPAKVGCQLPIAIPFQRK
jgi:hypothetical protein